jgi:hypothetical protein
MILSKLKKAYADSENTEKSPQVIYMTKIQNFEYRMTLQH